MTDRFWEIAFDLMIYGGIFVVVLGGAMLLSALLEFIVDKTYELREQKYRELSDD